MVNERTEELLKTLKKHGVKHAAFETSGVLVSVEFFPSVADDLEKRSKADEDDDAKVNPATGLTRSQTQDILGMDE